MSEIKNNTKNKSDDVNAEVDGYDKQNELVKQYKQKVEALNDKKRELADEHSHFNSFANNKLFETFKTKDKLIKYIVEINNGFNDNIKNLKKNLSKKQENNKDTLIKSKSNKKLAFKLIETNPKYVLNEETLKILNLKKF